MMSVHTATAGGDRDDVRSPPMLWEKKANVPTNEEEDLGAHDATAMVPAEVLTMILGFVSTRDLRHAALVCRRWHAIVADPTLWREKSVLPPWEQRHLKFQCEAVETQHNRRLVRCLVNWDGHLVRYCDNMSDVQRYVATSWKWLTLSPSGGFDGDNGVRLLAKPSRPKTPSNGAFHWAYLHCPLAVRGFAIFQDHLVVGSSQLQVWSKEGALVSISDRLAAEAFTLTVWDTLGERFLVLGDADGGLHMLRKWSQAESVEQAPRLTASHTLPSSSTEWEWEVMTEWKHHTSNVRALAVYDGCLISACEDNQSVKIWGSVIRASTLGKSREKGLAPPKREKVECVLMQEIDIASWSPKGAYSLETWNRKLYIGTAQSTVLVWDFEGQAIEQQIEFPEDLLKEAHNEQEKARAIWTMKATGGVLVTSLPSANALVVWNDLGKHIATLKHDAQRLIIYLEEWEGRLYCSGFSSTVVTWKFSPDRKAKDTNEEEGAEALLAVAPLAITSRTEA